MTDRQDSGFRDRVYEIVSHIPRGRVMTYGQIAALAGSPRAARIVGGIAHWGDPALPWQRVVKKDGSLAEGYPGGTAGHAEALRAEGVNISVDYKVDIKALLWRPGRNS
ncbi:MAG TPA: methylated-DNA--[protein]-cysteine S-methyltransferase [Candidatus Saccharimonadales bacterium]|nr:methylated-DNA--[protein]-cysteine S-methyltransferase [Candidatus Saccharimonadales bacterium]